MKDVRLTVKKRAFPSQGRVRLNIAHLPELGIKEGDHVDLINETTKKTVTATVIADTMVRVGHVRVSEEDLKTIGLNDDDGVLVRKTPPLQEKIKKAAADANKSFSEGVDKLDAKVKKATVDAKASASKAADSVKKEAKKASVTVEKAAVKTVKTVKKAVKKATTPHGEL
jgi:nucleoid-associated protein YgaU